MISCLIIVLGLFSVGGFCYQPCNSNSHKGSPKFRWLYSLGVMYYLNRHLSLYFSCCTKYSLVYVSYILCFCFLMLEFFFLKNLFLLVLYLRNISHYVFLKFIFSLLKVFLFFLKLIYDKMKD